MHLPKAVFTIIAQNGMPITWQTVKHDTLVGVTGAAASFTNAAVNEQNTDALLNNNGQGFNATQETASHSVRLISGVASNIPGTPGVIAGVTSAGLAAKDLVEGAINIKCQDEDTRQRSASEIAEFCTIVLGGGSDSDDWDPDSDSDWDWDWDVPDGDDPDEDHTPGGTFTILNYVNVDGSMGSSAAAANISLSGSATAPVISWSVSNVFALGVISGSSALYGIYGERMNSEGDLEQIPFAFSSVTYGDYGRSNTAPRGEGATAAPPLQPGEAVVLEFPVRAAQPNSLNEYPFRVSAETAGGDFAVLDETLSVSTAVYGSVEVDGNTADWDAIGAVRQYLSDASEVDAAFKAHNPFVEMQQAGHDYFAEFATAWDDQNFYAMARVHDPEHTWQLSNFRDFERYKFFPYPNDHVYRSRGNPVSVNPRGLYVNIQGINKGEGYKRYPEDVFDPTDWQYRMGMFRNTDYDYVAYQTRYGGELPDAKVAVEFDEETGIATYEIAIPWSEMDKIEPEPGRELKLGWMVRKDFRERLEWTEGRSATVTNAAAFEPEYIGSWSVETPWGMYRAQNDAE